MRRRFNQFFNRLTIQIIKCYYQNDYVLEAIGLEARPPFPEVTPSTFPDGMDVEIFSFETLTEAWKKAKSTYNREHVTPYITNNSIFKKSYLTNEIDYGHVRLTVDEPDDLKVVKNIIN